MVAPKEQITLTMEILNVRQSLVDLFCGCPNLPHCGKGSVHRASAVASRFITIKFITIL